MAKFLLAEEWDELGVFASLQEVLEFEDEEECRWWDAFILAYLARCHNILFQVAWLQCSQSGL